MLLLDDDDVDESSCAGLESFFLMSLSRPLSKVLALIQMSTTLVTFACKVKIRGRNEGNSPIEYSSE